MRGAWLACAVALMLGCASLTRPASGVSRIQLPPGFAISVHATNVESARSMAIAPSGMLFVGSYKAGSVYAVPWPLPGRPSEPIVIARDLEQPNGVAFRDGALYVAERRRIIRFPDIEKRLASPPAPEVVFDRLPRYAHHGLRVIHFGPDGRLYVAVGSSCNICNPERDKYGVILRLKPGGEPEVFARGVRNSVGFDWHPSTKELWFTDNGRDFLGNETPPDELNRAPKPGLHFGFPFCHAGELVDPQFGLERGCDDFVAPAQQLGPHVAALGMRFYDGKRFPAKYRGRIFIAEHGSWNRDPPSGYRVTMVTLEGGRPIRYEPFAEGWLRGAWGRPVDVEVAPDGSLLVSDDTANVIYRIAYEGSGQPQP